MLPFGRSLDSMLRTPLGCALVAALICATSAGAQDAPQPMLSEEIRRVLAADGVTAAQARFEEVFPDQADRYQPDVTGLSALMAEQMNAGDMAAAEAVGSMISVVSQAMLAEQMPEIAAAAEAERQRRDEARSAGEESAGGGSPGPARDDLRRFRGLYGDREQDPRRDLFVIETCDGYLVAGPMWADVSPWHLASVGDAEFEYADSFTSLALTFELEEDDGPLRLHHTVEGVASPLDHLGPLPEEWGDDCLTVSRGG